jgi:hypothetical protein
MVRVCWYCLKREIASTLQEWGAGVGSVRSAIESTDLYMGGLHMSGKSSPIHITNPVEERITTTLAHRLKFLDLSHEDLASVPESIEGLTELQELDLSDNCLTELPEFIDTLPNLRKLDLRNNALTRLPDSICRCTSLRMLSIRSNQLMELPECIGKLRNLHRLDLSGNQLTTIPRSIGDLIRLEELRLSGNRLVVIPAQVGDLINLQWLNLSGNGLRTLPAELGNLYNLRYFNVHGNPLECDLQKLLARGSGYLLAFLAMRLGQRYQQLEGSLFPETYLPVEAMKFDTDFDAEVFLKKRRRKPAGFIEAYVVDHPPKLED